VMFMTNQSSIQEVLFFPQMRPEKKEQQHTGDALIEVGVPGEYVPLLLKANINSPEELKKCQPNKLFNDLCGLRKKMKLDIPAPSSADIQKWIDNA